jgi:hypothetical protein
MGVQPATASAPTCPTRRSHRGLPGLRQRGRDLEHVLARHGPGGGARPLPPDRAQGAGGRATARSGAAWRTTAGPVLTRCWPGCPACATWCSGRPRPGADAAPRIARRTASLLTGDAALRGPPDWQAALRPPAVDRLPAAPPACPSPSCTAMAASCSRCSRAARCTTTSAPASTTGDRFHWFSSTGWIMWNAQLGALLGGTTVCHLRRQPRRAVARRARLGHAVALCRRSPASPSSAPARPSTPAA